MSVLYLIIDIIIHGLVRVFDKSLDMKKYQTLSTVKPVGIIVLSNIHPTNIIQNFVDIDMTLKVYKNDASPPSRAVMMLCDILDLPFELIDVHVPAREHLTPEFLKKNPLHTIPVLEDDDITIIDSHAILSYLVEKYGKEDTLYPKDLKKRTLVNEKLFFDTGILFQRMKGLVLPVFYEGATSLTEKQLRDVDEAYGFLEEFLTRSKYIAGDSITIADLSAITNVTSIAYVVPIDSNKYPKTVAWVKELEEKSYCKKYNAPGTKMLGERLKQSYFKDL